jgi:TPP-dependent pyruvate/acetoin dehydrogenase alpha subunit
VRVFASHRAARGDLEEAAPPAQRSALEAEINAAIEAEEPVPPPARATLIDDVYARPPRALVEQLAELERVLAARPRGE